jgi:hypothetical protein
MHHLYFTFGNFLDEVQESSSIITNNRFVIMDTINQIKYSIYFNDFTKINYHKSKITTNIQPG